MELIKQRYIDKLLAEQAELGLLHFVPTEHQEAYGLALFNAEAKKPYSIAANIEIGGEAVITDTIILPDSCKSFVANNRKFRVTNGINTERYKILERYQIEFGFGVSFKEMYDAWVLQYQYLQGDNKRADAAVHAYKVINGITNIDESLNYAFQMCTLFINYEGEDIRDYDLDIAAQKIEDWKEGAIDARFFFRQAALSVNEYNSVYNLIARDISSLLQVNNPNQS